jgi:hypothetical protein
LRLCSAIPENRSFFGRFFSLTTACFFVRSLVSFLSDAGDVGDAGVWLRLRRAKPWREILLAPWRELLLSNASDLMKEPQLLMQRFNLSGESHDQPDTVEINAAGRTEVLNLA